MILSNKKESFGNVSKDMSEERDNHDKNR